jgi:transcriptional regulator with XRE-family HTH domain
MNKYSITKQPSLVLKEVAARHKKYRKNRKISQETLAERSGISLGSLKRFESTGQISFESLLKLARFFGLLDHFSTLFEEKEDMKKIAELFNDKTQ